MDISEVSGKWDRHFMRQARLASEMSKDPSTQVGAVIVDEFGDFICSGFNGIPRGVKDTEERLNNRDVKLLFVEHAERNAIFSAARRGSSRLTGCIMYINGTKGGLPPCAPCARAIVQSGISAIVITSIEVPERWKETCDAALTILEEGGVKVFKFVGELD